MNLKIEGGRPPSARKTSDFNPITGESYSHSRPGSRPHSRPDGVPALHLGALADTEEVRAPSIQQYEYNLRTPHTNSTVSWGTRTPGSSFRTVIGCEGYPSTRPSVRPSGVPVLNVGDGSFQTLPSKPQPKPKEPTAWDKDPVPENLPPPSERHRQQYKQYEEDLRQQYRSKNANITEAEIEKKVQEIRDDYPEEVCTNQQEKQWTKQPYSTKQRQTKKSDIAGLEEQKRKNKLIETVMIDQLSRAVISDPEQNNHQGSPQSAVNTPGRKRGAVRTLHDTRVKTSGSATENLLSRRVRFGARILTRNSRDAIRDLTGFIFAVDNSITIYEFKQFGKSSKALPFIHRGVYSCPWGRRRGEMYSIWDIVVGTTLIFPSQSQHSLPDSVRSQTFIKFRITDVDEDVKRQVILQSASPDNRDELLQRLEQPLDSEQLDDQQILQVIQGRVQAQLRKRGVKTLMGLNQQLSQADRVGDSLLDKLAYQSAFDIYRIKLSPQEFDIMWHLLDEEGAGVVDWSDFLRGLIGGISENRIAYVRKAFQKLNASKDGYITVGDIRKFYNTHKHPSVLSGECKEADVLNSFIDAFPQCKKSELIISYPDFEAYYQGISIGISNDDDFINILKNAWTI